MKTIGLLFISLFLYINVLGQETKRISDSLVKQNLKGTWYVYNSYPNSHNGSGLPIQDSLVFNRHSKAPDNLGDRIEIFGNGKFVDAYSAECGNDSDVHFDTGSWSLGSNETIILEND